ncbi:MAG: nucleotide exchange factor GrpE [Acidobacteria bacterium]|nr:nucleotide exchange factor GrpE [Acidobacteriota bacterium]
MGEDRKQQDTSTQAPLDEPLNGNGLAAAEEGATVEAAVPLSPQNTSVVPEAVALSAETGQADASAAEPPPAVSLEQFETVQKEKKDLYDRFLRKQAEFDNFRKRTEREKIESYDFAVAGFILGLLPALDGLERGLSVTAGETVESYKKGIELVLKQLRDQMASAGVQPISATGKMFDPNFHQAVMREESTVLQENEIIEEMQRGYTFKDRLLRPSMVKVAVASAQSQVEEPAAPTEPDENEAGAVD